MSTEIYNKEYFRTFLEETPSDKLVTTVEEADLENRKAGKFSIGAHILDRGNQPPLCNSQRMYAWRDLWKGSGFSWPEIGDGEDPRFPQPTPKERLLAAFNRL